MVILICVQFWGCEDYVEIDVPDHKIVKETVFASEETAARAMKGIYNELFRASFSGGWQSSVTVLAGLSSDVLEATSPENPYAEFQQNEISPNHPSNYDLWSSAYNIIYMTNSLLEGLGNTGNLSQPVQETLEGEARFIRAFTYFYLVNLYGEVPLILSTDYRKNSLVTRDPVNEVYAQIIADLDVAVENLDAEYQNSDRTNVNVFAAIAFRARVALFMENWDLAETLSNQVIDHATLYQLLPELDEVFLANSKEAIWQISPIGRGNILTSTGEGQVFIGTSRSSLQLNLNFVQNFEPEDKRLSQWIGHYESSTRNFYFPHKYKDRSSLSNITEYSMVLRLAEQFLIRAEARARQEKLSEAISDLNAIRARSGEDLVELNNNSSKEEILELILLERKKELFAEWGHRWFDLKRTGKADDVLSENTSFWEPTDVFYPIPEQERMKNLNIEQNAGY